jgi:hypothetical protein
MRYHLTFTRMANINNKITNIGKDKGKFKLLFTVGRNVK